MSRVFGSSPVAVPCLAYVGVGAASLPPDEDPLDELLDELLEPLDDPDGEPLEDPPANRCCSQRTSCLKSSTRILPKSSRPGRPCRLSSLPGVPLPLLLLLAKLPLLLPLYPPLPLASSPVPGNPPSSP